MEGQQGSSPVEPTPSAAGSPPAPASAAEVARFLHDHCVRCHGATVQKGELTLERLDWNVAGADQEKWQRIADRLARRDMPPRSQPQPDPRQRQRVVQWIHTELAQKRSPVATADPKMLLPISGNRVPHDLLFAGVITAPPASPPRLWRISPYLYTGFVTRIAGKNVKTASPFPLISGQGFRDYADLYALDEAAVSQLLRNARQIVEAQCGLVRLSQPVKEFRVLLEAEPAPRVADMRAAIRKQFQLALAREPSEDELHRFTQLMQRTIEQSGRLIGVRDSLAAILLLPEALYRSERGQGPPDRYGRVMLAPRELAYAIAFALTDQGPDPLLWQAAQSGRLASAADVRREVQRILNDPRIPKPRILRFFEEYFEYPAALDVFKDLERGTWRPDILVQDTRQLIEYILERDRAVLKELLTTTKSFVNYRRDPKGQAVPALIVNKNVKPGQRRAWEYWELYGLPPDWPWTAQQPIDLPAQQRAGILTQPSWLAAFATNDENHPIRRGKWIRERLLGDVIPDLPVTVDAQLPRRPDLTLRQRLQVTQQEYCWQCHQKMNPLGLALECYDYLGRYRTTERVLEPSAPSAPASPPSGANRTPRGKPAAPPPRFREVPVDASGLIEGSGDPHLDGPVAHAVELMHKLADSPRVRQVFIRHAFRYWMGRNETLADAPTLLAADRAYVESGGSMKALIIALLSSDSFLYRWAETK
jgi:hypothetical protein